MRHLLHRFINDQSGVTAIEYGLIASLVAVAIREHARHQTHHRIHPGQRQFDLTASSLLVRRLDFGRCQNRAFGGQGAKNKE
jgi:hypothetical protein